jgi:hypothetical protein
LASVSHAPFLSPAYRPTGNVTDLIGGRELVTELIGNIERGSR